MAAKKPGKKKGSRVSLSKLSNKHLNRLAKQGKLKKRLESTKFRRHLQQRVQPTARDPEGDEQRDLAEQEPADIPLEEADYEFFSRPGRDLSFLAEVSDGVEDQRQKKKRKAAPVEDDALERKYESTSHKSAGVSKDGKSLLPIKDKKRVIARVEEAEAEDEDEETVEEPATAPEPAAPLPVLSTAQLFAQRQQKLRDRKQTIALLANSIIENPEEHFGKLRELRMMLKENEPDIMVTTHKLVMVTLMEVFKDIIPGYRIRLTTEQEKKQAVKKDTKKLREFEESLLNNYKHYLEFLELMVKGKPPKSNHRKKTGLAIPEAAAQSLRAIGLKCLCELLAAHPHFNFRTNIVTIIVPYATGKNSKNSDTVCHYVKRIFKEDKSGDVSLELVRLIGRVIKARNYNIHPKVLNTFLSLRIREVQTAENKPDNKEARRERMKKMSKKERKHHRQLGALEKELQDAAITDNKQHKLKLNTEIVNMIFLSYFRILKHGHDSVLLEPVLEGLARFAHLINVEYFEDLFAVLKELVDSGELTYRESLHCVQTAFTILSGQGAALNVDPLTFYKHLYNTLLTLNAGYSSQDLPIALESLESMIHKRKKQVSLQRVLAFTKRLATVCLQLASHGCLATMAALRTIITQFPKCDMLFDMESQGSGLFMPELEDPEHCNAINTALWELAILKRHYHPVVCQYAGHLAVGGPSQGAGQLPPELARKSPVSLFHEYDVSEMAFKPDMQKSPSKKKIHAVPLAERLAAQEDEYVSRAAADLDSLDFHGHFIRGPRTWQPPQLADCNHTALSSSTRSPMLSNGKPMPNYNEAKKRGTPTPNCNKAKKRRFMAYKLSQQRSKPR